MAQLGTHLSAPDVSLHFLQYKIIFFKKFLIIFFLFSSSGGFIHLTESFRWDLLVALQVKESKRPQEKVKIKL